LHSGNGAAMPRAMRKGIRIHRLRADQIARRRQAVRHLYLVGYSPVRTLRYFRADPKLRPLIEAQRDPYRTLRDDLQVIREAQVRALTAAVFDGVRFGRRAVVG